MVDVGAHCRTGLAPGLSKDGNVVLPLVMPLQFLLLLLLLMWPLLLQLEHVVVDGGGKGRHVDVDEMHLDQEHDNPDCDDHHEEQMQKQY